MPDHLRLTRRQLVGGIAGVSALTMSDVLLTGCRLRVGGPTSTRSHSRPPTPDELALTQAASDASSLVARYAAAEGLRPDLAARLALLAADHTDHLRALVAMGVTLEPPTTAPTTTATTATTPPTTTATAAPTTSATAAPAATSRTAVIDLIAAERQVIGTRSTALITAGPDTARLLASFAACGDQHVALLGQLPAAAHARTGSAAHS